MDLSGIILSKCISRWCSAAHFSTYKKRMGGGELWSPQEKLCFSLLQRFSSPPPTATASASAASSLLQTHAFLLRRALDANLSLLTLLISSFSNLATTTRPPVAAAKLIRHARLAFDLRPAQDAHLCNSIIHALVRHRRFRESLALYCDLRRGPSPPNSPLYAPDGFTFPYLLKSCASLADPAGLQLHIHVIKMGFDCSVFVSTGLIDMYTKFTDLGSARQVFDGMPERSPASWTSLITGYVRGGNVGDANELFHAMPEKDPAAFNVMIDGLVKMGDVGSARRLFDEMPERNVVSWTCLIYGYCKDGDMLAARALFDQLEEKNLFSWNVMIGGYCQNRQPERALELFRELQSDSCPFNPDEVTIVSIAPAIGDMGAIDLARWIHSFVRRKGLDRGINVANTLVAMYAKCGDVLEARRVFDGMPDKVTASWNAMINGLAVNGQAQEALDVFAEMCRCGFCPNELTMIGVLSACCHGGLVEEGRRWFREMEACGIDRIVEHYGCMVDLLGRGGYLDEAERLIKEMPCHANGIILSSLLFACCCHGDADRAERVMRRAIQIEPWNVRNHVMLRNLYAEQKRWKDVERIKELIGRHGGKQEAGCSVVEVGSRVWEFVSGDRTHSESEAIYRVILYLQLHMVGRRGKGAREV